MSLFYRIRELAGKKGITMYALSKETGISQATFSRLKNEGINSISLSNATTLADYFNVDRDWLLTGEGEMLSNAEQQMLSRLSLLVNIIEGKTPFLEERGYDKNEIYSIIKKDYQTRNELIGDLVEIEPQININWILTGEEPMFKYSSGDLANRIVSNIPKEGIIAFIKYGDRLYEAYNKHDLNEIIKKINEE